MENKGQHSGAPKVGSTPERDLEEYTPACYYNDITCVKSRLIGNHLEESSQSEEKSCSCSSSWY